MSRSGRFAAWRPGGGADPGEGREPDPRFTFANERTFLAWSRTALALVVAGLGIVQLLPPFPGVPAGRARPRHGSQRDHRRARQR